MDRAVGKFRHLGDLRGPGCGEGIPIGVEPMGLTHHLHRNIMRLHRPDQLDAPLDLAVVEHDARRRNLHGSASRPLVDEQLRLAVIEMAERIIERHRTIALALRDCEQPGFPRRCLDGVDDLAIGDGEAFRCQRLQPDII